MFIGGGAAIVSWLVSACILWRRGGRPAQDIAGMNAAELVICPKCGYALNGLREARCPECGEAYTLDGLYPPSPRRPAPRTCSRARIADPEGSAQATAVGPTTFLRVGQSGMCCRASLNYLTKSQPLAERLL